MGNPFDKIKTETAQINANRGIQQNNRVQTWQQSYASIYDEYNAMSADIKSLSVNVQAEIDKEIQETQERVEKQQRNAAILSFVTSASAALPGLVSAISSTISASKAMKAGDTSASAQTKLQQMETQLSQAKTQSADWGRQIADATNAKPTAEQTVKDQETIRVEQQKLFDKYKGEEETLQASLDNETDSQIVAAKGELDRANAMKTTKTVSDGQGGTKEVEDPQLKLKKDNQIAAAQRKIEERKAALKAEIATAKENKEKAQRANAEAITKRDEAQEQVNRYKATINDLTPKKNNLDGQIKQLEAEIARLKGDGTENKDNK